MAHRVRVLGKALGVAALLAMLAACGGGSDGIADTSGGGDSPGNDSGDTPPDAVIEGVATPSSVSVVTATNAS